MGRVDERRVIIKGKILEGWQRIADSIDWTFDTPETLSAEAHLEGLIGEYVSGRAELSEVKQAFDAWASAQTGKKREQVLFE